MTVKPLKVADAGSGSVTVILYVPTETFGTRAVSWVALTKVEDAGLLPKVTVSADTKLVPVIVTCVPGAPEVGDTLVIVGGPVEDEM